MRLVFDAAELFDMNFKYEVTQCGLDEISAQGIWLVVNEIPKFITKTHLAKMVALSDELEEKEKK